MKKAICTVLLVLMTVTPCCANDKALHFGVGALVSYVGEEDGLMWARPQIIGAKLKEPGYVKTGKHSSDGALDGHSFDLYVTNDGEPEWMLQQLRGWRE